MNKTSWIVFYDAEGQELCAITAAETFSGEIEETIKLLAYENSIPEEDITFAFVTR